ncbi:hypothetical protein PG987_010072 [Apiospora arundinis]
MSGRKKHPNTSPPPDGGGPFQTVEICAEGKNDIQVLQFPPSWAEISRVQKEGWAGFDADWTVLGAQQVWQIWGSANQPTMRWELPCSARFQGRLQGTPQHGLPNFGNPLCLFWTEDSCSSRMTGKLDGSARLLHPTPDEEIILAPCQRKQAQHRWQTPVLELCPLLKIITRENVAASMQQWN